VHVDALLERTDPHRRACPDEKWVRGANTFTYPPAAVLLALRLSLVGSAFARDP
jgi:hypothetical protein